MRPALAFFTLLAMLSLTSPASAEVFTSPREPKSFTNTNSQLAGTLQAVAQLTGRNRGADALILLKNALDTGIISSDHHSVAPLTGQELATMGLLNGSQALTAQQVVDLVSVLSKSRRGDEAVSLYARALETGVVQ